MEDDPYVSLFCPLCLCDTPHDKQWFECVVCQMLNRLKLRVEV